ncbi:IGR protein motif-domain-containing protein [Xylariaceae sp. FL0016]|nr:IGR protein motif-domain-containing protein [Xylariaceae sp. FL0016]
MVRIKPILRPQQLRSALNTTICQNAFQPFISISSSITSSTPVRASSSAARKQPKIPKPTPFIPDVPTFLTVIGRGLSAHASKFPDWESLFSLTSDQLRELGVEPPRSRKYLIRWRQRFTAGRYGIGGDLVHVDPESKSSQLRILEVVGEDAEGAAYPKKFVVNVPPGKSVKECAVSELSRVSGFKVRGAKTIVGPYALPMKQGEGATIKVTEGMWEDKRGHKIDGGERRRTEVRYKKRIAERREARERGL